MRCAERSGGHLQTGRRGRLLGFIFTSARLQCGGGRRLTVGILAQLLSRRGRLSNLKTFRQTDARTHACMHAHTHGHNRHAKTRRCGTLQVTACTASRMEGEVRAIFKKLRNEFWLQCFDSWQSQYWVGSPTFV